MEAAPSPIIPTVTKTVSLQYTPVSVEARSVHFADEPGMQVALRVGASYHGAETYMTAAEARAVGQALIDAADHFDAAAAKLAGAEAVEA